MNMIKVKLHLCGHVSKDVKLWSYDDNKVNYYFMQSQEEKVNIILHLHEIQSDRLSV